MMIGRHFCCIPMFFQDAAKDFGVDEFEIGFRSPASSLAHTSALLTSMISSRVHVRAVSNWRPPRQVMRQSSRRGA